jgi:hypothetical protein
VELPYLSTEAADYVKTVVEPQRIGKYPQITQITQILFEILRTVVVGPNKALDRLDRPLRIFITLLRYATEIESTQPRPS